jgi:membrane-associated phospholipid phosphatase
MAVRTAKTLSLLFQPLLTGLYLVLAASLLGASSLESGVFWAVLVICLAVGLPALDIARRVRAGRAGDFQLALREERLRPLLVAIGCAGLALFLVASLRGPRPLLATMLAGLACGLVLTAITARWKISFHSGALAAAVVLAFWYGGLLGLLLVPLLAAVGWSRVRLGRHSAGQVLAGAAAATVVSYLVLKTLQAV